MWRVAFLFCLSSCASLKAGWAKVTWLDGGVTPVVFCTAQVNGEGDIEMYCTASTEEEKRWLYKREVKRHGGEL